jgi:hypothetical protein
MPLAQNGQAIVFEWHFIRPRQWHQPDGAVVAAKSDFLK